MILRVTDDIHAIVEGETVLASARLFRPYDDLLRLHGIKPNPPMPLVLTDLEGTGNSQAMAMLTRHFIALSEETPLQVAVALDNPKADKLIRVYKRMGCKPVALMMNLGWKGV